MAHIKSIVSVNTKSIKTELYWLKLLAWVLLPLALIVYFIPYIFLRSTFFLTTLIISICAIICLNFTNKKDTNEKQNNRLAILMASHVLLLLISIISILFLGKTNLTKKEKELALNRYFEKIRKDPSRLAQFMLQMPKGGDLHHHYSGSVYAETYWEFLIKEDYWINTQTLLLDSPDKKLKGFWTKCSKLSEDGRLPDIKQRIFQQWSIKDYFDALAPSDKHFFEAFGKFSLVAAGSIRQGLMELKKRAINENLSYIETMAGSPDTSLTIQGQDRRTQQLIDMNMRSDTIGIQGALGLIYRELKNKGIFQATNNFLRKINSIHYELKLDDSLFTIRYLTATNRTTTAVTCFRKLLLAFDAASKDTIIGGVNILSPEDNEISLRDFNLHMEMFRFCKQLYPSVKTSMHAGELWPGLVRPEELRFHIRSTVHRAGADRIGHGVDIPFEKDAYATLESMKKRNVAVEVNLSSNEFILKVKGNNHPLMFYKDHGVPIVISTDDPGILRTDLTMQYILAAERYKELSYSDLKEFVFNSITYSFLKNKNTRSRIRTDLNRRFADFENKILELLVKK